MKWILRWAAVIVVSLLVGRAVEAMTSPAELLALKAAQQKAYSAVSSTQPLRLWHLYWSAMFDFPPVEPAPDALTLGPEIRQTVGLPPLPRIVPKPRPELVLGYWAQTELPLIHLRPRLFAPVIAFADVAWHLLQRAGWFGRVLLVGQLACGFLLTWLLGLMLGVVKSDGSDASLGAFWLLTFSCIGAIALGSVLAMALRFVMLEGLLMFGWFTGLAAVCCGAGSLASIGWAMAMESGKLFAEEQAKTIVEAVV